MDPEESVTAEINKRDAPLANGQRDKPGNGMHCGESLARTIWKECHHRGVHECEANHPPQDEEHKGHILHRQQTREDSEEREQEAEHHLDQEHFVDRFWLR